MSKPERVLPKLWYAGRLERASNTNTTGRGSKSQQIGTVGLQKEFTWYFVNRLNLSYSMIGNGGVNDARGFVVLLPEIHSGKVLSTRPVVR